MREVQQLNGKSQRRSSLTEAGTLWLRCSRECAINLSVNQSIGRRPESVEVGARNFRTLTTLPLRDHSLRLLVVWCKGIGRNHRNEGFCAVPNGAYTQQSNHIDSESQLLITVTNYSDRDCCLLNSQIWKYDYCQEPSLGNVMGVMSPAPTTTSTTNKCDQGYSIGSLHHILPTSRPLNSLLLLFFAFFCFLPFKWCNMALI